MSLFINTDHAYLHIIQLNSFNHNLPRFLKKEVRKKIHKKCRQVVLERYTHCIYVLISSETAFRISKELGTRIFQQHRIRYSHDVIPGSFINRSRCAVVYHDIVRPIEITAIQH